MNITTITDIFTYFAKFPDKSGVLKSFRNTAKLPGYQDLKDTINALPDESLIPDIKEFVFGMNEDKLNDSIKNLKDMFLFVEYGQIKTQLDIKNDIFQSSIVIAVNVAVDFNWRDKDSVEESILSQKCLSALITIIKQLKDDDLQNNCPLSQFFNNPSDIMPIEPKSFHGKLGWNIIFYKNESFF